MRTFLAGGEDATTEGVGFQIQGAHLQAHSQEGLLNGILSGAATQPPPPGVPATRCGNGHERLPLVLNLLYPHFQFFTVMP